MAIKEKNNMINPIQPARKPRRTLTAEEKNLRDEKKAAAAVRFLAQRQAAPAIRALQDALTVLREGNKAAALNYAVNAVDLMRGSESTA